MHVMQMPSHHFSLAGKMMGLAAAITLTACASPEPPEPIYRTQRVEIPVIIPCAEPGDIPPKREYADERLAREVMEEGAPRPSGREETLIMGEGLAERDRDLADLRAVAAGCVS